MFGVLTAGAAAAASDASADDAAPPQPDDKRNPVFETTEHVRAYYRSARG